MSGPIERGLRSDLRKRGIKPHHSTLAANALALAKRIDLALETSKRLFATLEELAESLPPDAANRLRAAVEDTARIEDRDIVSAMRELRLTVAQLMNQPGDEKDAVTDRAASVAAKL